MRPCSCTFPHTLWQVSSSNVPQELKNTTMQMKVNEDQVAELTAENFQLKRAINKLRILQKLKDETSRSAFSKKVEASESAKKHASKELYCPPPVATAAGSV